MEAKKLHKSVLLDETREFLQPQRGGLFIDATLGLGGHSEALLESSDAVQVIGIDQDQTAIALASERLARFGSRFRAIHANFRELRDLFESSTANGILADLGVSSMQLDSPERGFSFRHDAPLDMRMNAESDEETAAELLKRLSEVEIARIIYEYGEERFSRRIARRIVERRERGTPVETTKELADLAAGAVKRSKHEKIHPATRTFQALRIAVNRELDILEQFVADAIDILQPDGRLIIINFHSLEDRIIKLAFTRLAGKCFCPPKLPACLCGARQRVEILTRRPILPSQTEQETNPRARSAKLRVCRKL